MLFLSTCRINDLDTALKFIFRLPVDEAFSNRVVWHQDVDIISWATPFTGVFRICVNTGKTCCYRRAI